MPSLFGINYDYAQQIIKKYNCLGAEGLSNLKNQQPQQRGGKKALLTDYQLEKLRQELASTPLDGGIGTGAKVGRWLDPEQFIHNLPLQVKNLEEQYPDAQIELGFFDTLGGV